MERDKLEIPASLETIKSSYFDGISHIKNIEISPKNKNFSYINDQFLIGKSNQNQEEFDIIHFYNGQNEEEVIIPPFIKIIRENAFGPSACQKIKRIIITEDSKLEIIEKYGLPNNIQKLFIPKNLKSLASDNFYKLDEILISPENRFFSLIDNKCLIKKDEKTQNWETVITLIRAKELTISKNVKSINDCSMCSKIRVLNFEKNSICERIGSIQISDLEKLYIPENLNYIDDFTIQKFRKLSIIEISPKCKSFKLHDNKCLLRKSEGSDTFDELIFCFFNIVKLRVPSSVKKITNHATGVCKKLTSLTFEENSSLETIGTSSFEYCGNLKQIVFPRSLSKIGHGSFEGCSNIKYIQFNGEKIVFDRGSFFCCDNLEIISFPNAKEIYYYGSVLPQKTIIEVRRDAKTTGFNQNQIRFKDSNQFLKIVEENDEIEKLTKTKDDLLSKISKQEQQIKQKKSLNLEKQEKLKEKQEKFRKITDDLKIGNQNEKPSGFAEIQMLTSSDVKNLQVVSVIGSGSAGKVLKVSKLATYAQKQMNVDEGFDFERFQNFTQEYKLLTILKHPNIIKVYGIFDGNEKTPPCILMEYCSNNLENVIVDKKLSAFDIAIIIYQIAEGIRFIHFKKVIHRDIKPRNILINEDKIIKICDFGISKYMFGDETSLTGGVGTQKFMAPEMINEEKNYTEKIDVYSFGVVIFYIITGQMPNISIGKIASGKKAQIPKDVNDFARSLINDCWNFDPKSRPSFAEICQRLKENNYEIVDLDEYEKNEVSNFILKHKATIPNYEEEKQTFLDELRTPRSKKPRVFQPRIHKVPE